MLLSIQNSFDLFLLENLQYHVSSLFIIKIKYSYNDVILFSFTICYSFNI